MPVFAPGVAAGINDSFGIDRQRQKDALDAEAKRLMIAKQQFDMQTQREQQTRDLRARQGFGASMYGVYAGPPGAGGPPPQPPPPGQSSAPPQPPQGQPQGAGGPPGMQPQGGPPQGQPPGAGAPPPQTMGGPPGGPPQQPRPMQAPPQPEDPQVHRLKMDIAALTREVARPGQNAEQRRIMNSELGHAQQALAQLTGQNTPYRGIPPAGGAPQQQPVGMQAPPPMASTQPQQPSLLRRFVMAAQKNNVPPEDLADQIKMLTPIMQNEMREELMTLRGTAAMSNEYIRMMDLELRNRREGRLETQGDQRLDQGQQKIELAKKKAAEGGAPTASELSDDATARVFYDMFKKNGRTPPFAWGKAGEADRAAWMRQVKKFSAEDGGGAGVAASIAEGKADASALAANQKRNVGLDVGARETLADMKTLDSILDRVATKGGAKVLNRPMNKLRDLGSDPEYGQLELAVKQVATKYERMLAGGILSVAQLHEGAREDAKKIMSGDMTIAEIRAKLPLMKREMDNAQKAGRATSKDVRGHLAGIEGEATNDEDKQAIDWAKAHPADPRAKTILKMHGM